MGPKMKELMFIRDKLNPLELLVKNRKRRNKASTET